MAADSHTEIMSIEELSCYLRIPKSTLYKLAQDGKLPGQKIGKQWRFGKQAIDRWINASPASNSGAR
jgi:excisionase family DNA binding protein